MSATLQHSNPVDRHRSTVGGSRRHLLEINPLGMVLGTLLAVSFTVCVVFDLIFPSFSMCPDWIWLLPGVTWISIPSFILGLIETFAYGWFAAVIFVSAYNALARKFS